MTDATQRAADDPAHDCIGGDERWWARRMPPVASPIRESTKPGQFSEIGLQGYCDRWQNVNAKSKALNLGKAIYRFSEISKLRQRAWRNICHALGRGLEADRTSMMGGVRRVCVLASSSRGGTSVTAELLQWQGANCTKPAGRMLTLPGEEKPHLILAGLAFPSRAERFDDLVAADARARLVSELLAEMRSEIGYPVARCDDLRLYATQLYRRLLLQWPTDFAGLNLTHAVADLTQALRGNFPHGYCDSVDNRRRVLDACVRCFPFIRPSFYDCWPHRSECDLVHLAGECWSIEETPFVLPPPWHNATLAELEQGCLLLRDPSNVWRLPFWRAVFPGQDLQIVHLVRDPCESVQGLCDGWNYPFGFQTIPSNSALEISGYTDSPGLGGAEWKRHRLNFSINRALSQKLLADAQPTSLVGVCAFQWREAHASILVETERLSLPRTIVNFADLRGKTQKTFEGICAALSLEPSQSGLAYARSFPRRWVMTIPSAKCAGHERWTHSPYTAAIESLISSGYFGEVAAKLGNLVHQ